MRGLAEVLWCVQGMGGCGGGNLVIVWLMRGGQDGHCACSLPTHRHPPRTNPPSPPQHHTHHPCAHLPDEHAALPEKQRDVRNAGKDGQLRAGQLQWYSQDTFCCAGQAAQNNKVANWRWELGPCTTPCDSHNASAHTHEMLPHEREPHIRAYPLTWVWTNSTALVLMTSAELEAVRRPASPMPQ